MVTQSGRDSVAGRDMRVVAVVTAGRPAFRLRRLLERNGHDVFVATSADEAFVAVARHAPDAVLITSGIPRIDSFDVGRAIRARGFAGPIIIVPSEQKFETP